jgi:FkbM family methyltransferase
MLKQMFVRAITGIRVRWFPSVQDRELARWHQDRGDSLKRFDYPLNHDSVVIDLGGFDGQWASDVFSRYLSNVYVFEAIPEYAGDIAQRFSSNSKIKVYPFAVGRENRVDFMQLAGVGSSMFRAATDQKSVQVKVVDAKEILNLCETTGCDLLKINIEGGEYEVLPRLIDAGLISKVRNLQIQFHDLGEDSLSKMKSIQSDLAKTHVQTWSYELVWESWTLRDDVR